MALLIDGKAVSAKINAQTREECLQLAQNNHLQVALAVVLVGDDPASQIYVNTKIKKCQELGIRSIAHRLPADTTQEELLALIAQLNNDPEVNGILVQSPPPPHIDEEAVIAAINPGKDVDCFHAVNVGKMLIGRRDGFFPCTPYGVIVLLRESGISTAGKHVVIIGRSNIVGKPLLALLIQKHPEADATVTCVHSRTKNLPELTRQADILISAIGKPNFVTADMVKPGAVVVDVGINRVPDSSSPKGYRVVGDVDFAAVAPIASAITPVPGGVGPMTIAMLMANTVKAFKIQHNLSVE